MAVVRLAAAPPPALTTPKGEWTSDVLEDARRTVIQVMRHGSDRARLKAAGLVLSKDWLPAVSDDDLLAEVKRRGQAVPDARAAALEEAAQIADEDANNGSNPSCATAESIASRIRAIATIRLRAPVP